MIRMVAAGLVAALSVLPASLAPAWAATGGGTPAGVIASLPDASTRVRSSATTCGSAGLTAESTIGCTAAAPDSQALGLAAKAPALGGFPPDRPLDADVASDLPAQALGVASNAVYPNTAAHAAPLGKFQALLVATPEKTPLALLCMGLIVIGLKAFRDRA